MLVNLQGMAAINSYLRQTEGRVFAWIYHYIVIKYGGDTTLGVGELHMANIQTTFTTIHQDTADSIMVSLKQLQRSNMMPVCLT